MASVPQSVTLDEWHEFCEDEDNFPQRGVFFPREYALIAGDDAISGLLLSQIVYWSKPGKNGDNKTTWQKTDSGLPVIFKRRTDWKKEISITARQYDTALAKLVKLGVVCYKIHSVPSKNIPNEYENKGHLIWLNIDVFLCKLKQVTV